MSRLHGEPAEATGHPGIIVSRRIARRASGSQDTPHEPEYRASGAEPLVERDMVADLLDDPEFLAWRDAERRQAFR